MGGEQKSSVAATGTGGSNELTGQMRPKTDAIENGRQIGYL